MKQYPDFLIKEDNLYHIVDAKYKLRGNLFKSSDDFRQILVYAKLFNKNQDIDKIKKIIIYVDEFIIDLKDHILLGLEDTKININKCDEYLNENLFNSEIGLLRIKIFRQNLSIIEKLKEIRRRLKKHRNK